MQQRCSALLQPHLLFSLVAGPPGLLSPSCLCLSPPRLRESPQSVSTFNMDPLSATASIITILQLSSKVFGYLNDVKDAPKDREKCAIEAANLNSLLTTLRFRLEGSSNTPWYTTVRALGVENGPLDQFKQALQQLQTKMTGGGKMKVGDALVWKFKKEEIASILGRMERLKTLVQVALQMDHLLVSMIVFHCIVK